jgi:hypothetical protein
MRFRNILPVRMLSRRASVGLGLVVLISTLGINGCVSYRLTGLYVEPSAGACIPSNSTAQFTAYGIYTESGHAADTRNITDIVTWTTDLPELATVDSSGLATSSSAIGLTNVKASAQGEFDLVWSSAPLTVKSDCVSSSVRTLSSIQILPGDQKLSSIGDTSQLVAVGQYPIAPFSDDLTSQVTWKSSDPQVATVSAAGFVSATGAGETVITASRTTAKGTVVIATEKIQVDGTSATQ